MGEDRAVERRADERARAEQLARWHADDQAVEPDAVQHKAVQHEADTEAAVGDAAPVAGRYGEPDGITR